MNLLNIYEVFVSKTVASTTVTFTVTFTGSMVRGNVPLLEILDLGANGCNVNLLNVVTNSIPPSTISTRHSVMPVYRLETTPPLSYAASANEIKDALEGLNLVARVDVVRTEVFNSFSWMVTFKGFSDDTSVNIPPLYMNAINVKAAILGTGSVTPVMETVVGGLSSASTYTFSVRATNKFGKGPSTLSDPAFHMPMDIVPSSPLNVRVNVGASKTVTVQFNKPMNSGGKAITHYRVEWDTLQTFDTDYSTE
jgi:hypothetical protein